MRRFNKIVWSPVEEQYLKTHTKDPVDQLCINLSKSRNAIKKKLEELLPGKYPSTQKKSDSGHGYTKIKRGKRPDLGLAFRSSWEANVCRWLRTQDSIQLIEYEPQIFSFASFGILHGTVSYTPDFRITLKTGEVIYIEVKGGLMKSPDRVKLNRFKKFYPEEFKKLKGVTPTPNSKTTQTFNEIGIPILSYYSDLNKQYRKILPNWE